MDKAIDLRSKCEHFRVLVIGRANAGKTTLLKKVCNSIEDPEIFSPEGEQIDISIVEGSAARGLHDIENQLIFKSNRQFIFHDSRGFESGSIDETEKVKAFIAERAGSHHLFEQLHAIWYCLPTDTNRPLLKADEDFFNSDITGAVPVIAIFTKFDGLVTKAFKRLMDNGSPRKEARERRTGEAQEMLTADFIEPLKSTQVPPSAYVQQDDMRKETSHCNELIEKTASALTDDTLRLLFVSVQRNNIDLCMRYAVRNGIGKNGTGATVKYTLGFFPHVWTNAEYDLDPRPPDRLHRPRRDPRPLRRDPLLCFLDNVDTCTTALETKYPHVLESLQTKSEHAKMVAAICICTEQTFTQASAKEEAFAVAFSTALDAYIGSTLQNDVNEEIAVLPPQYFEEREDPNDWRAFKKVVPKLVEIIKKHRLRFSETI